MESWEELGRTEHRAGKELDFSCKNLQAVLEGGRSMGVASRISTAWRGKSSHANGEQSMGGPVAGGWSGGCRGGEKRVDSRWRGGRARPTGCSMAWRLRARRSSGVVPECGIFLSYAVVPHSPRISAAHRNRVRSPVGCRSLWAAGGIRSWKPPA